MDSTEKGKNTIPTVVIELSSGGIISSVCADQEVRVILVDHMTEGADEDELSLTPSGEQAIISAERPEIEPERTKAYTECAELEHPATPSALNRPS